MKINPQDYQLESYNYELDTSQIAQRPVFPRDSSKLLVYNLLRDEIRITTFSQLPQYLPKDSLVVLNNSKVVPARVMACKTTGAMVEVFFLNLHPNFNQDSSNYGLYNVMLRSNRTKKVGMEIQLPFSKQTKAIINESCSDGTFILSIPLSFDELINELKLHGMVPIPPYIRKGQSDGSDFKDYQNVHAVHDGSLAAPTAGLHFTPEVFSNLKSNGHTCAYVTLHVGLGTFVPVATSDIREHQMHYEYFSLDENQGNLIQEAIHHKKPIIAVGTTTLRVLESVYPTPNSYINGISKTNIFLYPGKKVQSIQGMITNFHLPKSTLLMLVSSLIGREKTLELYEIAKQNEFRFYSYGDAMLINLT